ncbi:MAG: bifunctional phosphoribosylaminoimidazolecarboxamide formyltransferase/IMP cyclohydrolase [Pseudomonadota bacterium]
MTRRRALLSVSDKTGLIPFARALAERGFELVSTGGTAKAIADAGLPVASVSSLTGFPEILDGRVKTLHPGVHAGLLAKRADDAHRIALVEHGLKAIDLLAVNLYPFEQTVRSGADAEACIENIDIGGPAMIRAAAKNHTDVLVVTDPAAYDAVLAAMDAAGGEPPLDLRRSLAAEAYAHTAAYDAAVSGWMRSAFADGETEPLPPRLALGGRRSLSLRYGENPHQAGALYRVLDGRPGVASATQLQGKALSFNNLNDADAAYELVAEFERPAIVIVKHANPCGVAEDDALPSAYDRALGADPVSAFGGVIAANRPIDEATAAKIAQLFAEVVIAPGFSDDAVAMLSGKSSLRLLSVDGTPAPDGGGLDVRAVGGGLLIQTRDAGRVTPADWRVVTKRAPTDVESADLLFAWRVCKHVKSNAIVLARNGVTVGVGAGQMSRVDSARIASEKAAQFAEAAGEPQSRAIGAAVASDAFFPFADGLLATLESGATAVIQPGGSVRDEEVIAAADAQGAAMVFTGMRHFRH